MIKLNKTIISGLILILAISAIAVTFPLTIAQEPFRKKTYAVIDLSPNIIGVGQTVLIATGITDPVNRPQTGWENVTVSIKKPDGSMETLGPIKTDFNGLAGILYVPEQIGIYTVQTHFPEQISISSTRGYPPGTIMEASESEIIELVVQEEELPWYPGVPLPTEFWNRPIDGQAREWNTIAGNWLDIAPLGRAARPAPYNDYAPLTAHVLWAKPLLGGAHSPLGGGLVGDSLGDHAYEDGDAYEGKFLPPIIIGGVLYFNRERSQSASAGRRVDQEVVAVNLRTGEELWARDLIDSNGVSHRLSFGQEYYWNGYNIHGVYSYLWATSGSTWHAFEPYNGRWIYSMTNVPGGDNIEGPKGEIIRYTVNLNDGWMTKWSTEKVVNNDELTGYAPGSWLYRAEGTTFDGRLGIEWNVTIPTDLPGTVKASIEDRVIGTNFQRGRPAPDELAMWAISTSPETRGDLLFNVTWPRPLEGIEMHSGYGSPVGSISTEHGLIIVSIGETRQHYAYSIDTGERLWGPTESQPVGDRFSLTSSDFIYEGIFYSGFMSGVLHAYNVTTGQLLWTYENVDPYVYTERWQRELGANYFSLHVAFGAAGKLYIPDSEHSPNDPKSRGSPFTCLNATTGEVIWKVSGMFKGSRWGGHAVIGDSIIATQDTYDQRVYAIGKGPSKLTVTASPEVLKKGSSVIVKGMITDISAGTEDHAISSRFPDGVPAIADEKMSEWMLYVYKQFPRPTDAVGVQVKIQIVDPDGNYAWIGTTTSDSYGKYAYSFMPQMEGQYTIIATFDGSNSYWGSESITYIKVDPKAQMPAGYPGYEGPSAQEVANSVVANLPADATPQQVADAVINAMPPYPEQQEITIPDNTNMFIVVFVLVAIAIVIGLVSLFRKK